MDRSIDRRRRMHAYVDRRKAADPFTIHARTRDNRCCKYNALDHCALPSHHTVIVDSNWDHNVSSPTELWDWDTNTMIAKKEKKRPIQFLECMHAAVTGRLRA